MSYSFLTIGKTQESKEKQEFKRYIGVGSSYVVGVNPSKEELDKLMGFESQKEPEYVATTEQGKEARVTFIVRTDPEQCNGVEITNRLMFVLRDKPAYNRNNTSVQVIDKYGNSTYAPIEDVKAHKKLLSSEGKELKIDTSYRMAYVGEADLVAFLKVYLCVEDAFNYVNGAWVKKANADENVFGLDSIKDYFKGDFSEIKKAIALQPNNKVKLLYGVRTTEDNKQYQTIATRGDLIMPNNAGKSSFQRVEKNLAGAKAAGSFANSEFKVQEGLEEWVLEPTNLASPTAQDTPWGSDDNQQSVGSEMPWD